MTDVVVLALLFGFFALCVFYVQWCDRIVEADSPAERGEARS